MSLVSPALHAPAIPVNPLGLANTGFASHFSRFRCEFFPAWMQWQHRLGLLHPYRFKPSVAHFWLVTDQVRIAKGIEANLHLRGVIVDSDGLLCVIDIDQPTQLIAVTMLNTGR